MNTEKELILSGADGSLSFGDHTLAAKAKKEDFPHKGDLYKVKTYNEITKLERNGIFVYESVPGTSVRNFRETEDGVVFEAEGNDDAQITLGLADDTEYEVTVNGENAGKMKTNLGGKLSVSVELSGAGTVKVEVKKA
ncbi:MAG: endosialidase [Lachnospiraceae bacterium]|nr:endosialidase [Lachnospiraceae bacterium]